MKRHLKKSSFFLLLVSFFFTSCTKKDDIAPVATKDVYVGGYEYNNRFTIAKLWKNGVDTKINDGIKASYISQVLGIGNDIYAVGSEEGRAMLWKNGVPTSLTNTFNPDNGAFGYGDSDSAFAIATEGSDVYILGSIAKNNVGSIIIWKNGVVTNLADGIKGVITSMVMSGKDIYMAGYVYSAGRAIATIWKNGVPTILAGGTEKKDYFPIKMAVNNTDVYVIGEEHDEAINKYTPILWKNGTLTVLSNEDRTERVIPNSIAFSGNDVYISLNFSSLRSIKLWKNGIITNVATSSIYAQATDLKIVDNDIYIAGDYDGVATLWKNGLPTYFKSPQQYRTRATSIFVK
jgi:hypothetical protein